MEVNQTASIKQKKSRISDNLMASLIYLIVMVLVTPGCQTVPGSKVKTDAWSGPPIVEWTETVELEHEDRKRRLERLAAVDGYSVTPSFYDYRIPAQDLGDITTDIPVLRLVFEEKVFFDTAKSELRDEAQAVLDLVAESLRREPPDVAVFVAGHTDSRGAEGYNYNLSVDRANSVATALANRGTGNSNIWRIGFGEAVPFESNNTVQGMAVNRRVEFLFSAKPAAIATWLARQADYICSSQTKIASQKCKKQIEVKLEREFSALPVFGHHGRVVPLVPNTKNIPNIGSDKKTVDLNLGQKQDIRDIGRVRKNVALEQEQTSIPLTHQSITVVDIPKKQPIVINLKQRIYHLPAPRL